MENPYIATKEALEIINQSWHGAITLPTLISWCNEYKIGFKFAGRYKIDKKNLIDFLKKGEPNDHATSTKTQYPR